ncbi:uncharacterized protein LOC144100502 [Amblyomma americanum]
MRLLYDVCIKRLKTGDMGRRSCRPFNPEISSGEMASTSMLFLAVAMLCAAAAAAGEDTEPSGGTGLQDGRKKRLRSSKLLGSLSRRFPRSPRVTRARRLLLVWLQRRALNSWKAAELGSHRTLLCIPLCVTRTRSPAAGTAGLEGWRGFLGRGQRRSTEARMPLRMTGAARNKNERMGSSHHIQAPASAGVRCGVEIRASATTNACLASNVRPWVGWMRAGVRAA